METLKISLKAARINAGLSQKSAAKALGITSDTLRKYETGKTVPKWTVVDKMKSLYKYPFENIFLPFKSD
jgi:DNA-binding XRE family transcriptional regulator